MKGWKVRLEFKLADMWVGAFWRRGRYFNDETGLTVKTLEIWICLLPCLPIHVTHIGLMEIAA